MGLGSSKWSLGRLSRVCWIRGYASAKKFLGNSSAIALADRKSDLFIEYANKEVRVVYLRLTWVFDHEVALSRDGGLSPERG
jgi:hypothetical protein